MAAVGSLYDRAVAEAARAERERSLRTLRLLDALDESVVLVDRDLVVEWASERARASLGVEPSLPLRDPWEAASLRELAATTLTVGGPNHADIVRPDGTTLELKALELDGTVALVVSDTTERRLELARSHRQALATGRELSRALAGIGAAVEALRLGAIDVDGDRHRFLDDLEHATRRATRLVDGLLAVDRSDDEFEIAALEPVRLAPVLRDVAQDVALHPGARAVVDCPDELAALAERTLLTSALTAVGEAAGRATLKGSIAFTARELRQGSVAAEVTYTAPLPQRRHGERGGEIADSALALARRIAERLDAGLEVERYAQRRATVRLVLRGVA